MTWIQVIGYEYDTTNQICLSSLYIFTVQLLSGVVALTSTKVVMMVEMEISRPLHCSRDKDAKLGPGLFAVRERSVERRFWWSRKRGKSAFSEIDSPAPHTRATWSALDPHV